MPRAAKGDSEDTKKTAAKKTGGKKKQTPYNKYMADNLASYKAKHTSMSHREAFAAVAKMWADADENPNKGAEKKTKKKA